jgi:hypothetical protein
VIFLECMLPLTSHASVRFSPSDWHLGWMLKTDLEWNQQTLIESHKFGPPPSAAILESFRTVFLTLFVSHFFSIRSSGIGSSHFLSAATACLAASSRSTALKKSIKSLRQSQLGSCQCVDVMRNKALNHSSEWVRIEGKGLPPFRLKRGTPRTLSSEADFLQVLILY